MLAEEMRGSENGSSMEILGKVESRGKLVAAAHKERFARDFRAVG